MWFTVVLGVLALLGMVARWRHLAPPERLLGLWVGLGTAELLVHDVGNERRFIFFIPALIALAAIVLGRERRVLAPEVATISRVKLAMAIPLIFYGAYVVIGALARLAYLYVPGPGVRLSAALAMAGTIAIYASWPRLPRRLAGMQVPPAVAIGLAAAVAAGQVAQYGQWAVGRTYKNYAASVELGKVLPAGTLVHGKLANGLSLNNQIRPVFVGRGFGNYPDRKLRDDVRYILTYVAPTVGYEGPVIQDVLEAYPDRTIIKMFDVAETATGHDRAALIDKFGGKPTKGAGLTRAHD
jgi:hypothetical protein